MSHFFKQLIERRVLVILGAYFAGMIALMEFTSLIVERYVLSDQLIDLVLAGLLSMLPAVALIAWHHGSPGRDQLARSEMVGVPANIAFSIALLIFMFGGEDLGAAAQTVESTDETGQIVSELVPKPSFMRRTMIYFFDPLELQEEQRWMSYGLAFLLAGHLEQDPFLLANTLYKGYANGIFWQVKRANSLDGLRINPRLKGEIAKDQGLDYFVSGYVSSGKGSLTLNVEIYSVTPSRKVAEFEVVAADVFALVDAASPQIKEFLEVQTAGDMIADEFPVSALITDSEAALEAYVTGANAMLFDNDRESAVRHWTEATTLDPTMADAHIELALIKAELGDMSGAQEAIRQALQHQYKLTAKRQLLAKTLSYSLAGDIDKERALYQMWMDLHPTDPVPHVRMAFSYLYQGTDLEAASNAFQTAYAMDTSQHWMLNQLAEIEIVRGNFDQAVALFEKIAEARPDEYPPYIQIGQIKLREGQFEAAQNYFERGALVSGDMVTPVLSLASLALKQGAFSEVQGHLDEAYEISRAPRQEAAIITQRILVERTLGRPAAALALVPRLYELQSAYMEPNDSLVSSRLRNVDLYAISGRIEEGKATLDELKEQASGETKQIVEIGYLVHYALLGQGEAARVHLKPVQAFIERFNLDHLRYLASTFEGLIELRTGNFEAAANLLRRASDELESSIEGAVRSPDYYDLQVSYASALRQAGNIELATDVIEGVIREWPANPQAQLELAHCSLATGDTEGARTAVLSAVQTWESAEPEYEPAHEARALLASLGGQ